VIIDIDEDSLSSYGQWPWPRTRIAELVTRLTELGALAIAFDIIFAEPDRLSPAAFVSRRRQLALMLPPGNSNAAATSRRNSGSCNRNLRGEQP
jgi:CHASE2 domain-containing sensor protein